MTDIPSLIGIHAK